MMDVMHVLVALAAVAITFSLAYNPGVRHGELAAAAAPSSVSPCKPGHVYVVIMKDGKAISVDLGKDDRYKNGQVWYQGSDKRWSSRICKESPEATAAELAKAAAAKQAADRAARIEAIEKDMMPDVPLSPTGITSEDIGVRDELKPLSTQPERSDVARKLEELATSPEEARMSPSALSTEGNDVSQYIAEVKQRSLAPQNDAPVQQQVPQMQDLPASDRTGLEGPSVPLPRERPSAWNRLWSDTPRAIRDFVTNEWDSLTGVPTAPRINGPDPSAVIADRFLGASEFPQTPLEPSDVINTGRPLTEVLGLPREIAGYTPA